MSHHVCRSCLLPGWNVCWPRRMLPPGELRWVCQWDRQTDKWTPGLYITLSAIRTYWYDSICILWDLSVAVTAIDGDFDFCQQTVKRLLTDDKFQRELQEKYDARLRQVNSWFVTQCALLSGHFIQLYKVNYYGATMHTQTQTPV